MIFRNWVLENFPFLEDDFDALTDYELFCKFMGYVKQLAADNVEFKKQLDEMQEKIDNIDVDDAVDKKLDEMVEDGTLAALINQEIFGELNEQVTTNKNNITSLQTATANLPTDEANITALQKFNNYTNKPLKYGKLTLPSEFSHYPFNLFREYDGTITDNLDLSAYDTTNIIYVDRDSGNDTSGTGAENAPYKTIKKALNSITNSLPYDTYKIVCKTYRFFRNEFINENEADQLYTMYKNIIIEPDDLSKQILICTDQESVSWTSDGGGVYHATRSGVTGLFDLREKDAYGVYKQLPEVGTLTECQNTVNSYYKTGSLVYIHTDTGAAPTTDVYMMRLGVTTGIFSIRGNLFLRLRNIDFYVSAYMGFDNQSTYWNNTLICENVGIYYCTNNNGFNIDDIKNVYLINCKTGYNKRDGFNYHYNNMVSTDVANNVIYEKNCISFINGLNDDNNNNNCSTIHDTCHIIRVNGVYQTSTGPVIADVDSSYTLMENCGVNQENATYNAYSFHNASGVTTGIAYLVDCKSLQQVNLSIYGSEDFKVRLKNFKGNYENPDLDIQLYEE